MAPRQRCRLPPLAEPMLKEDATSHYTPLSVTKSILSMSGIKRLCHRKHNGIEPDGIRANHAFETRYPHEQLDVVSDERCLYDEVVFPRVVVMTLDPDPQPAQAEHAELERAIEALARWPRLSHLLRYMGEKLFSGQVDQINEFNIATEVLGRSKNVFNAAEDAIARVETHRLRKRLAQFYETDGKDHPIQVNLPAGSYVPAFIAKPQEPSSPASQEPAPESGSHPKNKQPFPWLTSPWIYSILALCLVLAGLGAYLHFRTGATHTSATLAGSRVSASVSKPLQPAASSSAIRLLAGYSGPPRTDSAGKVWNPDRYFSGGGSWERTPGFIARTSDPFIFEHSRTGDFSYRIPLKPGSYELHLFFLTPARADEAVSTFNVTINGNLVLPGFDVNMDAMGPNIADERVFRDVSPGQDGFLRLGFSGAMGPPKLNAIEILRSAHHAQLPIRLIMQTTPMIDHKGRFWHPDNYFMSGRLSDQLHPLPDSPDPDLFSGERYGHFSYAIPVDTRDTYTLVLHFAEFYFHSAASGTNGRLFKVMCNGQTLLNNFDIFKEAGSLHELTKTFHHLKPSAQGKLNITFEPIVNNATVSGIEVLDESR